MGEVLTPVSALGHILLYLPLELPSYWQINFRSVNCAICMSVCTYGFVLSLLQLNLLY